MNILHLLPTNQFGGGEKVVLQLAKYDDKNNIYVGCGNDISKIFKKYNINAFPVDISNKKKFLKNISNFIKQEKIDIIHAHDNTISILAYLCKKKYKLKVKVISHIHNNYPWLPKKNIYKVIDQIFRNKYNFNIYCGEKVREYYLEHGSYINDAKAKVISNAIEIVECKNSLEKSDLKIEGKFIYGFIGRITDQKGLEPFIKQLEKNKVLFDDSIFLIIGDGDKLKQVKKLVEELKLEDYFKFVGFQEDVYKFFNVVDVMFLPSLYEGLPMIILEAMAHEKAIVSMDVGSINEVISDGITGLLVCKENYNEFIKALIKIKLDENLRVRCEKKSKEFIKQNYNISRQVNQVREIYENIVNN
jgi:glycosyltransferase involved in cell wall biosynthesis